MEAYSVTDVGRSRTVNQDYIHCTEHAVGIFPNLFIVADGMGGHKGGGFASRFSVEHIVEYIAQSRQKTPIGVWAEAIAAVNEDLITEAGQDKNLEGMGTTIVMASVIDSILYVANIGDSRLYLISGGEIRQITEDHSLVETMVRNGEIQRKDARLHPNKNIITRALGGTKRAEADFFEVNLQSGDLFLMCSDGLSNMVEDDEILSIILRYEQNLGEAGRELVECANAYGGKDNIALILVEPERSAVC